LENEETVLYEEILGAGDQGDIIQKCTFFFMEVVFLLKLLLWRDDI
jgi:hypothetical protein